MKHYVEDLILGRTVKDELVASGAAQVSHRARASQARAWWAAHFPSAAVSVTVGYAVGPHLAAPIGEELVWPGGQAAVTRLRRPPGALAQL